MPRGRASMSRGAGLEELLLAPSGYNDEYDDDDAMLPLAAASPSPPSTPLALAYSYPASSISSRAGSFKASPPLGSQQNICKGKGEWLWVIVRVCVVGFLVNCQPSEPYLTRYLKVKKVVYDVRDVCVGCR